MVTITVIVAIAGVLIFLYINWLIQEKQEQRRVDMRERRREQLEQLLEQTRKMKKDKNDAVSDTTEAE